MITPWPEMPMFSELPEMHAYERARAEAALSRLRVAVKNIYHHPGCAMIMRAEPCDCGYHEALAAIGELPA